MQSKRRTHGFELADTLLNGQLEEFVKSRREAGRAWRLIARDLFEATDRRVDIAHETLRSWFLDVNGDTVDAA